MTQKMTRRQRTEQVLASAVTNELSAIHAYSVAWRKAHTEKRTVSLLEQARLWAEDTRKALLKGGV